MKTKAVTTMNFYQLEEISNISLNYYNDWTKKPTEHDNQASNQPLPLICETIVSFHMKRL